MNFAEIPSLCHPFYLRNVIATSDSGKWNPEVLGPCRNELVGRIVYIIVEHEEDHLKPVVPCEMHFTDIIFDENRTNLFDWLIDQQLNNGTELDCDDELILNV